MSDIRPGDRECVRLVAALLGSSREAVCGKSRHPSVVRARWACMVALRRRGDSTAEVPAVLDSPDDADGFLLGGPEDVGRVGADTHVDDGGDR